MQLNPSLCLLSFITCIDETISLNIAIDLDCVREKTLKEMKYGMKICMEKRLFLK